MSKITKEAAIDGCRIDKTFDLGEEKAAIDKEQRIVEVVVSSESRDRDGDRILQKGIDHSNSKTVLWGHNYGRDGQLPIAKVLEARIATKKGVKVTIERHQFPSEGKHQLSDDVFNLINEGIITSTSIGFMPKKFKQPQSDEEREKLDLGPYGVLYEEIEKLETSWVPVPSNRDAVMAAISKGLVKSQLKELIPEEEWLTKEEVEKPSENFHACDIKSGDYDRYRRVKCDEKHDGKCIDVVYGIKGSKSEITALYYDKEVWTASAARSHCKGREGTFAPATRTIDDVEETLIKTQELITELQATVHFMNDRLSQVEKSAQGKKPDDVDEDTLRELLEGLTNNPSKEAEEKAIRDFIEKQDLKLAQKVSEITAKVTNKRLGRIDPSTLTFKRSDKWK